MNTQNKIFTFTDGLEFLDSILALSCSIQTNIDKIAKIEPSNKMSALIRVKRFIFIGQTLKFFNGRAMFIRRVSALDDENLDLDVLKVLLRGLIEIYCQVVYVAAKEQNIKSYLWQEISILANMNKTKNSSDVQMLQWDYQILSHFGITLPKINILAELFHTQTQGLKDVKELAAIARGDKSKNIEGLHFPGLRSILKNYYDENDEPKIPKMDMYSRYSEFSEQIHANVYYEGYTIGTEKYQVVTFLILIYLKFLKSISVMCGVNEKEISALIESHKKEFAPKIAELWKACRVLR